MSLTTVTSYTFVRWRTWNMDPDLLERVQQKYMSSYLGVSLRTFQNMREKYRHGDPPGKH